MSLSKVIQTSRILGMISHSHASIENLRTRILYAQRFQLTRVDSLNSRICIIGKGQIRLVKVYKLQKTQFLPPLHVRGGLPTAPEIFIYRRSSAGDIILFGKKLCYDEHRLIEISLLEGN